MLHLARVRKCSKIKLLGRSVDATFDGVHVNGHREHCGCGIYHHDALIFARRCGSKFKLDDSAGFSRRHLPRGSLHRLAARVLAVGVSVGSPRWQLQREELLLREHLQHLEHLIVRVVQPQLVSVCATAGNLGV